MATITHNNVLAINPGFEDVLDAAGTVGMHDTSTFEIINATSGVWDGFVFQLTGSGFTYSGTVPTGGTIDAFSILDGVGGNVIADAIPGVVGFGNSDLAVFWTDLQSLGPIGALDDLLSLSDDATGSDGADHIEAYSGVDTFDGGDGDDTLQAGPGEDAFRGGDGADTLIFDAGDAQGEEEISGSDGLLSFGGVFHRDSFDDILLARGNNDFSGAMILDIQKIVFDGATSLTFSHLVDLASYRAGTPPFEPLVVRVEYLTVVGDAGANSLHLVPTTNSLLLSFATGPNSLPLDMSGWTFQSWTVGIDTVTIDGRTQADSFGAPPVPSSIDGSDGYDRLFIDRASTSTGYSIDLTSPALQTLADGTTIRNLEVIAGNFGAGQDHIVGGDAGPSAFWTYNVTVAGHAINSINDDVDLGGGNDTFDGRGVNDRALGGAGNDILNGGAGGDALFGGSGDDQLLSKLGEGPTGDTVEYLDGGADTDFAFIDRSDRQAAFTLDISDPSLESNLGDGTYLINVERIEFRAGRLNDNLIGGALADILIGNNGNDFLGGGGGNDDLQGGNGSDTLTGDAGNDALAGGSGNDDLDGGDGDDRLTAGSGIDFVEGGDGTDTAVFSGPRAAYTITPSGNNAFQISGPDGLDFLINVEFAAFDDMTVPLGAAEPPPPPPPPAPKVHWMASKEVGSHPAGWLPAGVGDFNNDGTSDLPWYNATNNNIDIWKLANGQWTGSESPGSHPAGYAPAGFGDFNHDGASDILWFNATTRDVDLWKIVDGKWAGSVDIGTHPAGYQPALVGDFNGDGASEIAWFNAATRDLDLWKIANGQWAGSIDVGTHPAGYQPALTGDFTGDGTSDVAWYNAATGDLDIWKMSNGQWAGSVGVGPHPAGWQPLGAGDFNGDGTSDIAWYNPATNNIDIWLINNGQWAGSVNVGAHPTGAVALGVGDFDHNGVADIMWRDTNTGHIDNWILAFS